MVWDLILWKSIYDPVLVSLSSAGGASDIGGFSFFGFKRHTIIMSGSSDKFQTQSMAPNKSMPTKGITASSRGTILPKAFNHIAPLKSLRLGQGPSSEVVWFLIKVAALEGIRRLSTPRFPFVWRAVQAVQFLCYPPLKWIQRWAPFKILVHGAQVCLNSFSSIPHGLRMGLWWSYYALCVFLTIGNDKKSS